MAVSSTERDRPLSQNLRGCVQLKRGDAVIRRSIFARGVVSEDRIDFVGGVPSCITGCGVSRDRLYPRSVPLNLNGRWASSLLFARFTEVDVGGDGCLWSNAPLLLLSPSITPVTIHAESTGGMSYRYHVAVVTSFGSQYSTDGWPWFLYSDDCVSYLVRSFRTQLFSCVMTLPTEYPVRVDDDSPVMHGLTRLEIPDRNPLLPPLFLYKGDHPHHRLRPSDRRTYVYLVDYDS
ncbi:hypothetical protein BC629DRAFT_1442168 [Irpex lacteus]|nr:hypothetical protein BC629DRAFT_1442168 [Irpex lacteus]